MTPAAASSASAAAPSPALTSTGGGRVGGTTRVVAERDGVEGRRLHAVVEGQTDHDDPLDAVPAQHVVEAGRRLGAGDRVAHREAAVAVLAARALAHRLAGDDEAGMQLGAPRVAHAVHRPRPAVGDEVRRARRVPVLGVHDGRPGRDRGRDLVVDGVDHVCRARRRRATRRDRRSRSGRRPPPAPCGRRSPVMVTLRDASVDPAARREPSRAIVARRAARDAVPAVASRDAAAIGAPPRGPQHRRLPADDGPAVPARRAARAARSASSTSSARLPRLRRPPGRLLRRRRARRRSPTG